MSAPTGCRHTQGPVPMCVTCGIGLDHLEPTAALLDRVIDERDLLNPARLGLTVPTAGGPR